MSAMCDLCSDTKCLFRNSKNEEQSCFLFKAKAANAEITFAPEDVQFGQAPKSKTRNKHRTILVEKDIQDPERDIKYYDNKRAKIRTRIGLYCCIVSGPMKFKILKVLPTRSPYKQIRDLQSGTITSGEPYDKYVVETPQRPSPDWDEEVRKIFEEDCPTQTLRVIPMKTFIRQVMRALKKQAELVA